MMSTPSSLKDLARPKPVVAVVQMTATPDKEATFSQLKSLVERAKCRGADMVFVPECADYVSESREQAVSLAESISGPMVTRYRDLAREKSLWISIGGFHEKPNSDAKQVYNTHLIIDREGTIQGSYRKVHLFDVDVPGGVRVHESSFISAGSTIGPPVSTVCGKVGMAICYDMRFPELATSLVQQGAEILTYPSAFTVPTGMAHWETLLRNRAIENQCYVIAAAQVGQHHAKRTSYGHAMVIDPWGTVIAQCHDTADVCLAEIDHELLQRRRLEMPVFSHKRHDIYGHITDSPAVVSPAEYQFGSHLVKNSSVFYRTAQSFAFVNRKPVLPGHVLLSPVRVAQHLADLTPSEVSDLFLATQTVVNALKKRYNVSSVTVAVQDGPEAGQTVNHIHVHVLPRKAGDFSNNDDIYSRLEKHDKHVKASEWRTDEEMAEDAAIMRTFFTTSNL
jgi:predicted amidohydrolase/diadenosine tetraphosphate (Ap4A) HIT family hydrolase